MDTDRKAMASTTIHPTMARGHNRSGGDLGLFLECVRSVHVGLTGGRQPNGPLKCQKPTDAPQQLPALFNQLVGAQ
jgi:hypothetical protein